VVTIVQRKKIKFSSLHQPAETTYEDEEDDNDHNDRCNDDNCNDNSSYDRNRQTGLTWLCITYKQTSTQSNQQTGKTGG